MNNQQRHSYAAGGPALRIGKLDNCQGSQSQMSPKVLLEQSKILLVLHYVVYAAKNIFVYLTFNINVFL